MVGQVGKNLLCGAGDGLIRAYKGLLSDGSKGLLISGGEWRHA